MADTYKASTGPMTIVTERPKHDTIKEAPKPAGSFGDRFGVLIALIAVYIIWGSTYLAIRVAVQGGFPPFLMAGIRFLTAGVLLYSVLRLRGAVNPTWLQFRNGAVVGIFLVLGGNGITSFAEKWVTSSFAALAVATSPLWASLFAGIWGKWPTRREWLGIMIGFSGIILLNLGNDLTAIWIGAVALIFSPICWAFGTVIGRRLELPAGLMASAAEMLGGGAASLLVSLILSEGFVTSPSADVLFAFVYLIIFGSIIAFSAYDYLLHHTRLAMATSYAYVNPPVAVMLGAIMLGEPLTPLGLLAMGVIVAGVLLIVLKPKGGQRASELKSAQAD